MKLRTTTLGLVLVALSPYAAADVEVVLLDGQVIAGIDVARRDGQYLLELESGGVIPLPAELVRRLRLIEIPVAEGLTASEPDVLAGAPEDDEARRRRGPSGLRDAAPRPLAGVIVKAPRTSEQLAVLGERARFPRSAIDPRWRPEPSFDSGRDVLAGNRARWRPFVVDPVWRPESAFDVDADVLRSGRSTWRRSPIDPRWQPSDGFR